MISIKEGEHDYLQLISDPADIDIIILYSIVHCGGYGEKLVGVFSTAHIYASRVDTPIDGIYTGCL